MQIDLIEVYTSKQKKAFHQFARDLYAEDSEFISHLDVDVEAIFDSQQNSEFKNGDALRWLAYQSGQAVGRVAAFYNRKSGLVGLGFFDVVQDYSVAKTLFDVALDWLKSKGFDRVEAPVNFGERDKYWGLMVFGFQNPSYQENYNFPYYQEFFERYGFTKNIEQTTSTANPRDMDYEKYKRFADRLEERGGYRAEHFRLRDINRFVKDFTLIYNEAWEQHEHFVPFTEERVLTLFTAMKPIIREDILWFLYADDKPIAFYLSIIDVNQIVKHLNGSMSLWAKFRFLWYKKTVRIDRIRGIIFGVVPEYQAKGVYSILVMKMFEVMTRDKNLKETELSWIGDFNPKMHALLKSLNATKTKVHNTYEKLL